MAGEAGGFHGAEPVVGALTSGRSGQQRTVMQSQGWAMISQGPLLGTNSPARPSSSKKFYSLPEQLKTRAHGNVPDPAVIFALGTFDAQNLFDSLLSFWPLLPSRFWVLFNADFSSIPSLG